MKMNIRKDLRLDGYTQDMLELLKKSGKFGSEAAIIRTAIQDFYRNNKNLIGSAKRNNPMLVMSMEDDEGIKAPGGMWEKMSEISQSVSGPALSPSR